MFRHVGGADEKKVGRMEFGERKSYLETEARIIAENKTYVAIVLRVRKARILKNLPLLAALSDLAPPGAKVPRRKLHKET